mgnify:FL=1
MLAEALTAARQIGDERARANALRALAPHLPPELLAEALTAALKIGAEGARTNALRALAPRLVFWAQSQPGPAFIIWCQLLPELGMSDRRVFLQDFKVVMPFTLYLVKEEDQPLLARKIAAAIIAVGQWWP